MKDQQNDFIVDTENPFNDSVFRSNNFHSRPKATNAIMASTNTKNGVYYDQPDDETYIFRTTKYNVYSVQHGVIRPIRLNNLMSNRLNNGLAKKQKGVYIVKYFNHYKNSDIKTILRHYATAVLDIDMDILETLTAELTSFISKPNQDILRFRIIKFISEADLLRDSVVSDDLMNGEIVIGSPDRLATQHKDNKVSILTIEIFDNTQDVYHLTLGNQVHSVFTSNNSSGKVGGHIKLTNHGMTIIDKQLTTSNIKDFGLFASRTEALETVNIDKRLEMEKLKHERMKQTNEIELTKLKRQLQIENFAADMYKRKLDLELTKLKFNSDKIKLYTTASSTYVKTGIDIGVKIITMFLPVPAKV